MQAQEEIFVLAAFIKATNENFKVIQGVINDYQEQLTSNKIRILALEKEIKAIKKVV